MSSQVLAWISGIAAILAAATGIVLTIREVRRKERRDSLKTIDEMEGLVTALQNEAVAYHAYVFGLRKLLADHGIDAPPPPPRVVIPPLPNGQPPP